MTPKLGSERAAVQNQIIKYVQASHAEYKTPEGLKKIVKLGWEYVSSEYAEKLRSGVTGFIFKDIFLRQICRLNSDFMNEDLAQELAKSIGRIPPTIDGNFIAWEYLKGLKNVFIPKDNRERNVKFIDTENLDNNIFQVTEEFKFSNGKDTIRPDIVFLINGVPVLVIETKAAHKIDGMVEAMDHIRRYHRQGPELMAILQVYAITHIIKYYYSATWNLSEKLVFNWKEECAGDFEILVKAFFDRERVVRLLTDFILFTREDDELKKVVLRPHQMRAVQKLIDRAKDGQKRRGLIWHTQGSGKTYTMIVAAQKIIEDPDFKNPTVLMLVDRNELESQLFLNIASVGIENVEVTASRKHLVKLLKEDKRGLIVSLIHKFDDIPEKVNERDNFYILVDEAHRTTGGKLGNYLMGALPNATYFGFTGTPIDKTAYGKGTFIVFGKDDPPRGYLDKYSISESIEDGTTVPLYYTLAPNELRVDKEVLEKEFLDLAEAEGISDIEDLNKVLEKAVTLRNMLKSPDRRKEVARYVAGHFRENVEPLGYKAFLVAVDREACALYKEELDKLLPKEYSEVVYSPFYNDEERLAKYHLSEEQEKRIRKAFKKPDQLPKILIVTEKLLTGFDAPILYCMYLDKPMRDHVLLQAIARVNRPYEDENGRAKPSGFVLDFVGIFDKLEKALAFDSSDIEGVMKDIEILKARFDQMMEEARRAYLSILEGKDRDKAVEAVLEYFIPEDKRQEYAKFFKELADIYDICSPDPSLRPYLDDFETLVRIYKILKEAYGEAVELADKEFSRKTARLVQERTESGKIKAALEIYEISAETLRKIEASRATDTEKIFNLVKSIEAEIRREGAASPFLLSIGDKAEEVVRRFRKRQLTTMDTLEALKKIVKEINAGREEQQKCNMTPEVFSVYWILEKEKIENAEQQAGQMKEIFDKFPHWKRSEAQEREVKHRLVKILLQAGMEDAKAIADKAKYIIRVLKGRSS